MSDEMLSDVLGENIPLSEMLATLRNELLVAETEGKDSKIRFQLEKVELELQIAVTRNSKGTGGIAFLVLSAGGERGLENAAKHTFRLTLTPVSGATGRALALSTDRASNPSTE